MTHFVVNQEKNEIKIKTLLKILRVFFFSSDKQTELF